MTLPVPDASRLTGLRRMKTVATGLLVVAAILFVVCRTVGDGKGVWGFLQAGAEASMIGGLADWFAVTALFRYPLGIPIPHTAIIPRKKDQIGEGLATFVQRYFLTGEVVGDRIAAMDVSRRAGEWLADPEHAARVTVEVAAALQSGVRLLNDDELTQTVGRYAEGKLRDVDVAPIAARVLEAVVGSGEHQVALVGALRGLRTFLDENHDVFRKRVYDESPEWVPRWVDDRVFERGFSSVQSFLSDVAADDDHELRKQFDKALRDYVVDLREDPARSRRLEEAKQSLLDHPEVRAWIAQAGIMAKNAVLAGIGDEDSELRRTAATLVARFAQSLQHDEALRARIEDGLQRGVKYLLARFGGDIGELISGTVARWDTGETARRLELQVGRDLQFIRVNGTVVGALVGVVIYGLGRFL